MFAKNFKNINFEKIKNNFHGAFFRQKLHKTSSFQSSQSLYQYLP